MIGILNQLAEQYASALEDYLAGAGESALNCAYELGRKAIAEEVGVLEMVSIHNRALANIFRRPVTSEEAVKMAERASAFFAESLAPFEMVLRGVREANSELQSKIEQIERAEEELQRQNEALIGAQQSLEGQRRRYQDLFEFAPDSYFVTNLDGIIQEANRPASELLDVSQNTMNGKSLLGFIAPDERAFVQSQLDLLLRGERENVALWDVSVRKPSGDLVAVALKIGPVRLPDRQPIGLLWLLRDTTERREIEEQKARLLAREHWVKVETEAARRLKFLAEVSTSLAGTLDYTSIPGAIARLTVPQLADCCFVHLIDGESMRIRHCAAVHRNPALAEKLEHLTAAHSASALPGPLCEVLRSGNAEILPAIPEPWLRSFSPLSRTYELLRDEKFASALLVPLIARNRPIGTITFFLGEGGRRFTSEDLELSAELGRRCALILENALLYHEVVSERDRAEKASQAREEFVAILSHELRTPLMTILGWARVLNRQPQIAGDSVLSEGVRSLEHNAQHITRLVEECLDVARISEGKIQLQKELVDLNRVANAAFEATRESAYAKDLIFRTQFSPNLTVWGDHTRLEEVILNLLTNAIKYTDNGGEVCIELRASGNEAEVEVRDTGLGIEPDFLEQIFEPFRQGSLNWYASKSGLGLGLTIARRIVDLHGGRIWAESAGKGRGSLFRLRLPLATGQEQQNKAEHLKRKAIQRNESVRVLFIEDSLDILKLVKTELEGLGYFVMTASDGNTGLEIAKREIPDIIVSDIKMPGFDGYELIKQLRQVPELAKIPAIALTGFGMKEDVDKALEAGYNAHLCKPAELDDLSSLIERFTQPQP